MTAVKSSGGQAIVPRFDEPHTRRPSNPEHSRQAACCAARKTAAHPALRGPPGLTFHAGNAVAKISPQVLPVVSVDSPAEPQACCPHIVGSLACLSCVDVSSSRGRSSSRRVSSFRKEQGKRSSLRQGTERDEPRTFARLMALDNARMSTMQATSEQQKVVAAILFIRQVQLQ